MQNGERKKELSESGKGLIAVIKFFIVPRIASLFIQSAAVRGIVTLLLFFVFAVCFCAMYSKTIKHDAKRIKEKALTLIILTAITLAITVVGSLILGLVLGRLDAANANQDALNEMFTAHILLSSLVFVVFGPITEELVFRKALNGIFTNTTIFIIVSSVMFGIGHGIGIATLYYIVMGILYSLTYIKTEKNVVASFINHAVCNGVGVLGALLLR